MRWTSWPERAQDADTKPRSRGSPAWAQGVLPEVPTDPAQQAQYINSVAAACGQNGPDDARQIARRDGVEMPRAAFEGRIAGKQGATGKRESYSNEARWVWGAVTIR